MPTSITSTGITFPDATTQTTAASGGIPAGSVVLFYQAAAPTGWTQVTTQNDKALRVVSTTGGGTGGTTAFSTVFSNQTPSIGATTLSTAQMPSHSHSYLNAFASPNGQYVDGSPYIGPGGDSTGGAGSSGSHTHSMGAVTLNVQYINIILCSKN